MLASLNSVDWSAAGALVTALATIALFAVTTVLARETRRLADLTSQPQVVATIQSNPWGVGFADLHVQNTGNAAAFDIEITFDPPISRSDPVDPDDPFPFQKISVLKPGQSLESYLTRYLDIIDDLYTVTISWTRQPSASAREVLSYTIRVGDVRGSSRMGDGDPLVQLAKDVKSLREDFHKFILGRARPVVDVFTSVDRQEREDRLKRAREKQS